MARLLYELVHKETFTNQLLALPRNVIPQIIEKVEHLRRAPAPDDKSKKRLVGPRAPTFRLRSGNYRIVYTFSESEGWVALLGVDDREDVYRKGKLVDERTIARVPGREWERLLTADTYGKQDARNDDTTNLEDKIPEPAMAVEHAERVRPLQDVHLPHEITAEFLHRLRIEEQHQLALITCNTLDDLILAAVPDNVRERVFDALDEPDFDIVAEKPSFAVRDTSDYQRFYEGELVPFLLRLDPEQERFVKWAVDGAGPALIKGGPGSGKTVIALYRVQALIQSLRVSGNPHPRILFTAYTNTLVTAARQMLQELLGPEDADSVEIVTSDKLVRDIANELGVPIRDMLPSDRGRSVIKKAMDRLERGSASDRELFRAIQSISLDYLLEEIEEVIVGREQTSLADYLAESRSGRGRRLTQVQRKAIWRIHEEREALTQASSNLTFPQLRRRVMELVREHSLPPLYDGVLIDEAQDLQPTILRLLVAQCKSKDRLFLTADPNQSIYGSGFRWADVHEDLQFRGRTGVLRTNYRSTHQIMIAAGAYLRGAELDEPDETATCPRNGNRPLVRFCPTPEDQMQVLAAFFQEATGRMHKGLGGCAVLAPTIQSGEWIAKWLTKRGLPATFMAGKDIRLDAPEVKVVTLQSAKGLEFPIVALAGFPPRFPEPFPPGTTEDEVQERLLRFRRTLYVGMTRAMESLLIVAPQNALHLAADAFDATFWDVVRSEGAGEGSVGWQRPLTPAAHVQISPGGSHL